MLKCTQGDDVTFTLRARTAENTYLDLTGATFSSFVRGIDGSVITIPNVNHTANPDQVNHKGSFTLALTDTITATFGLGTDKDLITKVTIAGADTFFHGTGVLTVLPAVPLQ